MTSSISKFRTISFASLGLLARILTINYFKEPLARRVEITTPISSWKRAYEGVYRFENGLEPYSGDLFHEYPISLQIYKLLLDYCDINWTFAAIDTITAILLQYSVYSQMTITSLLKQKNDAHKLAESQSFKVLLIYLFSPITIMTCAGLSTSIFTNFLISAISFMIPMKYFKASTCVLCAFLACNNIYYLSLVLPIFLCLEYCNYNKKESNTQPNNQELLATYYNQSRFYSSLVSSFIIFSVTVVILILTSYFLMGNSWAFLSSTYLYILKIQDATPNIGMFWYLIIEVFDQFLDFFTWTIQINAFVHIVPLSIYLGDDPFFLLYVNILTATIFQPYPSLANIGLITSLLPQFVELNAYMKRGLISICAALMCMVLWPVFWHLWINIGTANSNFYFGFTLTFTLALIIFLTDILNAYGYMNAKLRLEHRKKME